MDRKIFSFLVLVLVQFSTHAALAQDQVLADHNCAITLPQGWAYFPGPMPDAKILSMFGKPGQVIMMVMVASDSPAHNEPMDDKFIADFEKGVAASGGKRVSGQTITVSGLKAYEWTGTIHAQDRDLSSVSQIIPTTGPCYIVQAMRLAGDVSEDPEIKQAFDSFHFINPPKAPGERVSSARRLGELIGELVGFLLVTGVLVAGIVSFVRRRKNAGSPSSSVK